MTDVVSSRTLFSGAKRIVMLFTNASDGTGESAVAKVDVSALNLQKVRINKVKYSIVGMSVSILFDHDTDDLVLVLQGDGCMDFTEYGGLQDPASAGGTGDILFTTNGASDGSSYTILLEVEPKP